MKSQEKTKRKIYIDKKRLVNSFKYALEGIRKTYIEEQNIKIHTIIGILVIVFGFILKINYIEWLVCLLLIGIVLMAEFFNTSIEYLVDISSPKLHPLAKAAKDTASAAVLIIALTSIVIGLLIFIPKIFVIILFRLKKLFCIIFKFE